MTNDFNVAVLDYDKYQLLGSDNFDPDLCVQATDFAVLLGAVKDTDGNCSWWCPNNYCTLNYDHDGPYSEYVEVISYVSGYDTELVSYPFISIRPTLKYSKIKESAEPIDRNIAEYYNTFAIRFGEYPQTIVTDPSINWVLEKMFKENKLSKTGKVYTTDSPYDNNWKSNNTFTPYQHIEYECDGDKYIRFKCDEFDCPTMGYFHDDNGHYLWVKVEPIIWRVNSKLDIAVTEKALISGIKYHYHEFDGRFTKHGSVEHNETAIYEYLNTYFKKEMIPVHLYKASFNYDNNSYNDLISKKFK